MMKKKLTKSANNVVLTGTLAGIAEYFGIDATIIRVIFVLLTFFGVGSPILLYILLAILIPAPKRPNGYNGRENPYYQSRNSDRKAERKEAEKIDDDDWSDF